MKYRRKHGILLGLLGSMCMILFGGCGAIQSGWEKLDGVASALGKSQITEDVDMIGKRTYGDDQFTGDYSSECLGASGRDVIFGGGSLMERCVHLTGIIQTVEGSAKLRIRQNGEVVYPEASDDGTYDVVVSMESGGNYIMIDYDDFVGSVKLSVVEKE